MGFILYLVVGFFSGLLGGMGMGGGTILIPALTVLLGVEQHLAQSANLIAFLPMAAFSLGVHKKSVNLKTEGVLPLVLSALLTGVLGSIVAAFLPAAALKKLFGAFLIALAVKGAVAFIPNNKRG